MLDENVGTRYSPGMPTLKPNTEVIKQALKGPRTRYTVAKHPGLYLYARGDGNGSWMLRYRAAGKRLWHALHNDAKNATLSQVIDEKDAWQSKAKLQGIDPKAQREA